MGLLVAASATTSAVAGNDNRLVNAVLAAGVVIAAWFVMRAQKQMSSSLLVALLIGSIVAGVAALILHSSQERDCTATNAAGERVVVGTELTERGRQYLREHPGEDQDALLEALGGLNVELAWTADSIRRCRTGLAVSGAVWVPLLGIAAVAALSASSAARTQPPPQSMRKPRVFISYTNEDSATARRLKQLLVKHDIDVLIDTDSMAAGESVTDFIHRAIQDCTAVVSVISSRSLTSAWVAAETIGGIGRKEWGKDVLLIACYLDEQWLQPEFRLQCTTEIDERLKQIENLLPEYAIKRVDPTDLNDEKTRLYNLRNNLGTILATLKDSLCLDVREGEFEASARKCVERIRSSRRGAGF
jgi:hypothetical protein